MPIQPRPLRSLLFVPGNKLDWMLKAPKYGADALIFDLEDATPPGEKVEARSLVRRAIDEIGGRQTVVVRVNALETGLLADDFEAIASPNLYAVMVPKVSGPEDVIRADALLSAAEACQGVDVGRTVIIPLMETAQGLRQAYEVITASQRVEHAGVGIARGGDTVRALGLGWTPEGLETLFLRSKILLDARAAGQRFPVAGLWTDIHDLEGFRRYAQEMRSLGYTGLHLIHPSHVPIANEVFSPSPEELAYWKGLLEALRGAEARGTTAITYEGALVDTAMVKTAEQVLELARHLGLE